MSEDHFEKITGLLSKLEVCFLAQANHEAILLELCGKTIEQTRYLHEERKKQKDLENKITMLCESVGAEYIPSSLSAGGKEISFNGKPLERCKYCDGEGIPELREYKKISDNIHYAVGCNKCSATSKGHDSKIEAMQAWNQWMLNMFKEEKS